MVSSFFRKLTRTLQVYLTAPTTVSICAIELRISQLKAALTFGSVDGIR
jgi:hypothetical protein